MDIFEQGKKVDQQPDTLAEKVTTTNSEPNDDLVRELKMRPYREYFHTQPYEDSKLDDIIKYVNAEGKKSNEEILVEIKRISAKLGQARLGETELEKVHRQVTLLKTVISAVESL